MKTESSESSEKFRQEQELDKSELSDEKAPDIVDVELRDSGIKAKVFNITKVLKGLFEEIKQYPILHGPNVEQKD